LPVRARKAEKTSRARAANPAMKNVTDDGSGTALDLVTPTVRKSVAQPSPDPVQRVAEDPRVVAALLGIQFRQC